MTSRRIGVSSRGAMVDAERSMRALVRENGRVTLVQRPPPDLTPEEVTIEVRCAGVCRTDLYVADGRLVVDEPRVLGHELSGVVVDGGEVGMPVSVVPIFPCAMNGVTPCEACAKGLACVRASMLGVDRDGAFADRVSVPAAAVRALPRGLPWAVGALMEPVAAALGVLSAPLRRGSRGAVFGSGRIADLLVRVLRAAGHDTEAWTSGLRAPASFAWVVEAAATADTLAAALVALEPAGTLVLKSRPAEPVSFDVALAVKKEITIAARSYGDFGEALTWLASERIDVRDLIGETYSLERWEDALDRARRDERRKVFFTTES